MAGLSIGGSKNKQKQSTTQNVNQTQTSTMTPEAKAILQQRMVELQGQQYQGLDPNAYKAFESPYQQEVIDATTADINAARGVAGNDQRAQALARGAKGLSDRRGVYEGELQGQYDRTLATTIGGLRQSGYGQAVGIAQNENTNKNQYDAGLQDRITQLLALLAGDRTVTTNGTTTGTAKGTSTGLNFGWSGG